MEDKRKKPIGELLLEAGLIDEHQLKAALAYQRKWGGRLGANLVTLRFITEDKLLRFLSSFFKIPFVNFEKITISPMVINSVPFDIAKQFNIIPLAVRSEGGRQFIFIATSDPTNLDAFDAVQFKTAMKVKPVLASDQSITQAIAQYYQGASVAAPTIPGSPQISRADAVELEEEITKAGRIDFIEQARGGGQPAAESEEEMIIFSGGEERHLAIDGESGEDPLAGLRGDPSQSHQMVLALSEILLEKKLITIEEIQKKLKPKT